MISVVQEFEFMARKPQREYIIRIAAGLFSDHGYSSIGLNDILASAGINKGVFYYYFDSKEDLITQTFEYCLLDMVASLKTFPQTIEGVRDFFRSQADVEANAILGCGLFGSLGADISLMNSNTALMTDYCWEYLTNFIKGALIGSLGYTDRQACEYAAFIISSFHGCMLRKKRDPGIDIINIYDEMVFGYIERTRVSGAEETETVFSL